MSKDEKLKSHPPRTWGGLGWGLRSYALLISFCVIVIDQITKYWSTLYLATEHYRVFKGFDLVLSYNTGAAFSFLAKASGWQRWFLSALALGVSVVIYRWLGCLARNQRQEALALSLVLGGALGNLIDRLCYGHVIDFIVLYYQYWAWPAFNVADSAISLGMILWIPLCFKNSNRQN